MKLCKVVFLHYFKIKDKKYAIITNIVNVNQKRIKMEPIRNKKASFNYAISDTYEAGIVLQGWEVKPILARKVNLDNTHIIIKDDEVYLLNMQVNPSEETSRKSLLTPVDISRTRKLMLKKRDIFRLIGKVKEDGYTLIPTKIYVKDGRKIKVEVALAKGKKEFDKRQDIKTRETDRELARVMKHKG